MPHHRDKTGDPGNFSSAFYREQRSRINAALLQMRHCHPLRLTANLKNSQVIADLAVSVPGT